MNDFYIFILKAFVKFVTDEMLQIDLTYFTKFPFISDITILFQKKVIIK